MLRFDDGRTPSLTAFAIYLRTGLRVPASDVEVKFNPWHDPSNGRFTFGGQGGYFPAGSRTVERRRSELRGHGGSFGGGGASGSWVPRPQPPKPVSKPPSPAEVRPKVIRRLEAPISSGQPHGGLDRAHTAEPPAGQRFLQMEKNGYRFQVDARNRPRRISGQLPLGPTERRSRRAQAQAGGENRRRTDDGGHYIGVRFNGPRDAFNHFAQDANFNRGRYRALEDGWAKSVRSGHKVLVDIIPHYAGYSQRPDEIDVTYYVDGKRHETSFPNEKGQK